MGRRYKQLKGQITHPDNISRALINTARGKRHTYGCKLFMKDPEHGLESIRQQLLDGSYTPGAPRFFSVYEPKERLIAALPFYDRVVQHALCDVLNPIFDTVLLPQSYACRRGYGTHRAAVAVQATLRGAAATGRPVWVLKTDFSKYFHNILTDMLLQEYARKVSCPWTLALIQQFVPPGQVGIPIGHLTSQLSANLYGHIVDRWLLHAKGITTFFRYMDDIVIIGHSREALVELQREMTQFVADLGLRFSHWCIQPMSRGVNFVGYRIWPTHKLLRRSSVIRAKQKIRRYTAAGDDEALNKFLGSWLGHARWADTQHLLQSLGLEEIS